MRTTRPIEDSPLHRRMARGHAMRCGHALTGYMEADVPAAGDAPVWCMVRTCCNHDRDGVCGQ